MYTVAQTLVDNIAHLYYSDPDNVRSLTEERITRIPVTTHVLRHADTHYRRNDNLSLHLK